MEQTKKKIFLLNKMKWISMIMGIIMFAYTEDAFGMGWALALGIIAAISFYFICNTEARRAICQYVADDLKDAVAKAGHKKCIVEIKSLKAGLVTRVYLIGAGSRAPICSKAVISRIKASWYRSAIWVTQLIDLDDESEMETAQSVLDEELLSDIKKMRDGSHVSSADTAEEEALRDMIREMMEKEETEQRDDAQEKIEDLNQKDEK